MTINIAEIVTATILALGGAKLIPMAIDGIKSMRNGRAREEKQNNRTALGRLVAAEERADNEMNFRRRVEEWASELVYMLKQLGVPDHKIPAKPQRIKENA
jgi:hypothetical protein